MSIKKSKELIKDAVAENNRTLNGKAHPKTFFEVEVLTKERVQPHERSKLVGRFGLKMSPGLAEDEKRLFKNGKWIASLRSIQTTKKEDLEEIFRLYGKENVKPHMFEYPGADGVVTHMSTYGAANMLAAANTITDPSCKKPTIWDEEVNAWFIPVQFKVRDVNGNINDEVIIMGLGFDNLKDQVFMQYGPDYFK